MKKWVVGIVALATIAGVAWSVEARTCYTNCYGNSCVTQCY